VMAEADRDSGCQPHVKHVMPQDPGQAGKAQNKQYSVGPLAGFDFKFAREGAMGDKEARAYPFAAQAEFGNVYLVEGDWIDEWLNEICSFPVGRYRDRVDSTSLAYLNLVEREREAPPAAGRLFMPEPDPQSA
jgi:predicted phage terminase large subunit-like protein